jgi:XTP/dITP diphosphohydrolase
MAVRVALASKNPGKVREIASILEAAGIELVAPPADWIAPEETEPDYRGNALLKARSLLAHTGTPCLADDSGIEVDALQGAPGPRSARFAGEDATDEENLRKLIEVVRRAEVRTARYRCVAVLVTPEGTEEVAEGTVEGQLREEPVGTGGFGYDPIFAPLEDLSVTMAQLSPEQKDAISHRGKAFRMLVPALQLLSE